MTSRITLTSAPRPLNGARRWHSMKRTVVSVSRAASERRIESLDVADLELELALRGELRENRGLRARARHRLLDEHVHAVLEEEPRQREMLCRRRGDRDGVDLAEQLAVSPEPRSFATSAATLRPRSASRSQTPTSSTLSSARCFCA